MSRIVDIRQVKAPRNITEALGNLCMLFAGALGDDDVKLFKFHAEKEGFPSKKSSSCRLRPTFLLSGRTQISNAAETMAPRQPRPFLNTTSRSKIYK